MFALILSLPLYSVSGRINISFSLFVFSEFATYRAKTYLQSAFNSISNYLNFFSIKKAPNNTYSPISINDALS